MIRQSIAHYDQKIQAPVIQVSGEVFITKSHCLDNKRRREICQAQNFKKLMNKYIQLYSNLVTAAFIVGQKAGKLVLGLLAKSTINSTQVVAMIDKILFEGDRSFVAPNTLMVSSNLKNLVAYP